MRPDTIIWFERLYLASLVIGAANMTMARAEMVAAFSPAGAVAVLVGSALLGTLLVLLVSRKRSRVAKWLLVGLFAFGLISLLAGIMGWGPPLDMDWSTRTVWIMQGVATGLLFTPSALDWTSRRPDPQARRDTLERTFE